MMKNKIVLLNAFSLYYYMCLNFVGITMTAVDTSVMPVASVSAMELHSEKNVSVIR